MLSNVGKIFFVVWIKLLFFEKYILTNLLINTNIPLFSLMFEPFSRITFTHAYFQNSGSNIEKKMWYEWNSIILWKNIFWQFCWHTNILLFFIEIWTFWQDNYFQSSVIPKFWQLKNVLLSEHNVLEFYQNCLFFQHLSCHKCSKVSLKVGKFRKQPFFASNSYKKQKVGIIASKNGS